MTAPTLVILAAGLASRYGAPKQLETVGPGGATIMDYALYDALRSGFGDAVLVVRREMEPAFSERIADRWRRHFPVRFAFQEIPAGRAKPWGTGEAVLMAAPLVAGPCAVVNADDFYGRSAFAALGRFLLEPSTRPPTHAVVGYPLKATLTEAGGVNRALLRSDRDGWLEVIEEIRDIRDAGTFPPDAVVSMNAWGFAHEVFASLTDRFQAFRAAHGYDATEFLLPTIIQEAIRGGEARVRVLAGGETWRGITYPADRPAVETFLRKLTDAGTYPSDLWR